ncbi:MAG: YfhO family protein [Planctomycetales bacterium]|nr:YfhO family protein [Planctomycetales bacterium]
MNQPSPAPAVWLLPKMLGKRRVVARAVPDTCQVTERRRRFDWLLLGCVLLMAVMAGPFFAGRIYTADDLGAFHIPVRVFYAASLNAGESFDWMPQIYNGFYLLGEGQAGTYHPLHLVAYRLLPFRVAFCLETLVSYPAMLLGMYLLLRRRLARRDAALFGALAFTFCGFNTLHFVHVNAVAVTAHIPWALLLIDRLVTTDAKRCWRWAVLLALLTASQLLLGYPQYVWFSLLVETGYAGWRLHDSRAAGAASPTHAVAVLAWFLAAKVTGALLAGVQLLPTASALMAAARSDAGADFLASGSLHPLNLAQLVAPYLSNSRVLGDNTHELGLYVGAVPLLLAVRAAFDPTLSLRLRRLVRFLLVVGCVALVLAFGHFTPLSHLHAWLPVVGRFRFAARYSVLFALAMSAVAAVGFTQLWRRQSRAHDDHRRILRRLTWSVALLSVPVALVGPLVLPASLRSPWWAVMYGPACLLLAGWLLVCTDNLACTDNQSADRRRRLLAVLLVAFTCVDLALYGFSYGVFPASYTSEEFLASLYAPPGEVDGRLAADLIAFDSKAPRTGDAFMLRGWSRADGYSGLVPKRQLDQRTIPALRLAAVHWVLDTPGSADIAGLVPFDKHWRRVPAPLPRARCLGDIRVSSDPRHELAEIDIETTALVDRPVTCEPTAGGTAEIVTDRPGHVAVRTDCDGPQLLVVSESFHPGWRVTVDGQPTDVVRTNGDFLGCGVPAGTHTAEFVFDPDSRRYGAATTLAGAALLVGMCVVGVRRSGTPRDSK